MVVRGQGDTVTWGQGAYIRGLVNQRAARFRWQPRVAGAGKHSGLRFPIERFSILPPATRHLGMPLPVSGFPLMRLNRHNDNWP